MVVADNCLGVVGVVSWLVVLDSVEDWLVVAVCLMLSRSSIMWCSCSIAALAGN